MWATSHFLRISTASLGRLPLVLDPTNLPPFFEVLLLPTLLEDCLEVGGVAGAEDEDGLLELYVGEDGDDILDASPLLDEFCLILGKVCLLESVEGVTDEFETKFKSGKMSGLGVGNVLWKAGIQVWPISRVGKLRGKL